MPGRSRFYYRDPSAPEPNRGRALSVIALIEQDGSLLAATQRPVIDKLVSGDPPPHLE
jgi:hypothetical protein